MEPIRKLPALGRAGGKAILFGEHAVVYGGVAVALPVRSLELSILLDKGEGWSMSEAPSPKLDRARDAVLEAAGWDGPHVHGVIESTLPLACGLGSSAALAVALARAVLSASCREHTSEDVRALADAAERVFHGNPSGVDVAAILQGHPIRFRRGESPLPLGTAGRFDLWVVDTGVRSETSEVVADVAQLRADHPGRFDASREHIATSVADGIRALNGGTAREMAEAMDLAMVGLRGMGVSHPAIENVLLDGRRRGALGGKLSGAGRGGVVLLLAPDPDWTPGDTVGDCAVLTRVTVE
jgi:mevalonate kinase